MKKEKVTQSVSSKAKRDLSIPVLIEESLLAGDLRYAGVTVLDKEKCRAYEKAMFHKQTGNFLVKFIVRIPDYVSFLILGSCLTMGHACAVVPFHLRPDWLVYVFVSLLFASGVLVYAGLYLCSKVYVWDEVDFGHFYEEMPTKVRDMAINMELLFPACRVRVRYMGPDPFLIVRRGRKMYRGLLSVTSCELISGSGWPKFFMSVATHLPLFTIVLLNSYIL